MSRYVFVLLSLCVACGGARSPTQPDDAVGDDTMGADIRTDGGRVSADASGRALNGLSPSSGAVTGGMEVFLSGAGFTESMFVRFGGRNCGSLVVSSATEARCTTPESDFEGSVDVEIIWLDGGTASLSAAYRYDPLRSPVGADDGSPRGDGGTPPVDDPPDDGGSDLPIADREPAPLPPADVFFVRPGTDATTTSRTALNVEAAVLWLDATASPGAGAGLSVELGYGPTDADPALEPELFDWRTAQFAFDGNGINADPEGTYDHFQVDLNTDPGTYRIALRAQLGADAPWTYSDVSGQSDGFDPEELPVWTVEP